MNPLFQFTFDRFDVDAARVVDAGTPCQCVIWVFLNNKTNEGDVEGIIEDAGVPLDFLAFEHGGRLLTLAKLNGPLGS